MNFIPQGFIKFVKSNSKDFCIVNKKKFQVHAVHLNFIFIKEF